MASMRDIRRRSRSVESTSQITRAMELVASAKLRKARERAQGARPYFELLYQTLCEIAGSAPAVASDYLRPRPTAHSLYVVIGGDRGLAGGYNGNLFRLAEESMAKKEARVIAVGKKAAERYESVGLLVEAFPEPVEATDPLRAERIARSVLSRYRSGEVDEVFLCYTQFVSALSQQPLLLRMLPLEGLESGIAERGSLVEYEPSLEALFERIVPAYLKGMLFGGIAESFASEQGARRTAMEAANKNAREMLDSLSLALNRARQAAITQEISEITATNQS